MRTANRVTREKLLTRTGECTFEDFCVLIKEYEKGDLIDGVVYTTSPENTESNTLFMWFGGLMFDYALKKKLGHVFGSRVAFRMSEESGPEPDIGFVKRVHRRRIHKGFVDGPPDLAVEIVCPESVNRDYGTKRSLYQRYGVPEYWILDEEAAKVTLLRLDSHGKYREVQAKQGILRSHVLKGFWIQTEWLWQEPLPDKYDTLTLILSGS